MSYINQIPRFETDDMRLRRIIQEKFDNQPSNLMKQVTSSTLEETEERK